MRKNGTSSFHQSLMQLQDDTATTDVNFWNARSMVNLSQTEQSNEKWNPLNPTTGVATCFNKDIDHYNLEYTNMFRNVHLIKSISTNTHVTVKNHERAGMLKAIPRKKILQY